MNRLSHILLLTAVTLASISFQVQAKGPDWYQIEVVIFAQQTHNPSNTEIWRDTFNPDSLGNAIMLGTSRAGAKIIGETELKPEKGAFELLPDTNRKLLDSARRISNSADLRLLTHLTWRQPILQDGQSLPILIQAGEKFNNEFELEGTFIISRNRFLHADTNLFFSKFERMQSPKALDWKVFSEHDLNFGQREWNPSFNDMDKPSTQFVRALTANLKQSRRMRSGELHYIDHPLFGLLVQITPYKIPDPAMNLKTVPLTSLPTKRPLPDSAISPDL